MSFLISIRILHVGFWRNLILYWLYWSYLYIWYYIQYCHCKLFQTYTPQFNSVNNTRMMEVRTCEVRATLPLFMQGPGILYCSIINYISKTNEMQLRLSSDTASHAATHKLSSILWNKRPPLVPILIQTNPAHTTLSCLSNVHHIITHPSTSWSP
jgi:hypothetical protein